MNKIVLIGAGSIGKRHLENFVASGARDVTIVDVRKDRLEEARERSLAVWTQLSPAQKREPLRIQQAETSVEAYKQHGPFEAALICVPPLDHMAECERSAEHGAAIYVEKPLAKDDVDIDKALELISGIKKRKLLNIVTYNYRFNGQLCKLRDLIRSNVVGKVLSIRGTFSESVRDWHPWEGLNFYMASKKLGGGALLDESHLLDIVRWLFGEISQVAAFNDCISSLKDEKVYETDDYVEMLVRFKSGVLGSLHMDLFGQYHQKKLEVIGENGTLFWYFDNSEISANRIEIWRGGRNKISANQSQRMPEAVFGTDWKERNQMYLDLAGYFMASVKAGYHLRNDVPDLEDGLQTMAVIQAARKSASSCRFEDVRLIK